MGLEQPNHRAKSVVKIKRTLGEIDDAASPDLSDQDFTVRTPRSRLLSSNGHIKPPQCAVTTPVVSSLNRPVAHTPGYSRRGDQGQKRQKYGTPPPASLKLTTPVKEPPRPPKRSAQPQSRMNQRNENLKQRIMNQFTTLIKKEVLPVLKNESVVTPIDSETERLYADLIEQSEEIDDIDDFLTTMPILMEQLTTLLGAKNVAENDYVNRIEREALDLQTNHARIESELRERINTESSKINDLRPELQTLRTRRKSIIMECDAMNEKINSGSTELDSITKTLGSVEDTRMQIQTSTLQSIAHIVMDQKEGLQKIEHEINQYDETLVQTLRDIVIHCGVNVLHGGMKENVNERHRDQHNAAKQLLRPIISVSSRAMLPSTKIAFTLKPPPIDEWTEQWTDNHTNDVKIPDEICFEKLKNMIGSDLSEAKIIKQWDSPYRLLNIDYMRVVNHVTEILSLYENNDVFAEDFCSTLKSLILSSINQHLVPSRISRDEHFQREIISELHGTLILIPRNININGHSKSTANDPTRKGLVPCFGMIGARNGFIRHSYFGTDITNPASIGISSIWETGDSSANIYEPIHGVVKELLAPSFSEVVEHVLAPYEWVEFHYRSKHSEQPPFPSQPTEEEVFENKSPIRDTKDIDLQALVTSFGLQDEGLQGLKTPKFDLDNVVEKVQQPSEKINKPLPSIKANPCEEVETIKMDRTLISRASAYDSIKESFRSLDFSSDGVHSIVTLLDNDKKPIACVFLASISDQTNITNNTWCQKLREITGWMNTDFLIRPLYHTSSDNLWDST